MFFLFTTYSLKLRTLLSVMKAQTETVDYVSQHNDLSKKQGTVKGAEMIFYRDRYSFLAFRNGYLNIFAKNQNKVQLLKKIQ